MAPQKTMAISQQQQATTICKDSRDQATKSRKRKNKQQSTNTSGTAPQQLQAVSNEDNNIKANGNVAKECTAPKSNVSIKSAQQTAAVASERTTSNKQQINQVPSTQLVKQQHSVAVDIKRKIEPIVAAPTVIAKQLSTDEPDDIDAGIELDGSSNSGSSVKDINEEQSKSTSVSPVMAQSNLVNENRGSKHAAIEVAPIEQMTSALCTDVTLAGKKFSATKQQLAANQQVIDADEQQLQQKLQNKQQQRKLSLKEAKSVNNSSSSLSSQATTMTPQSPALCKICDQHVYQMERILAEKAIYHRSCFRCHQCKTQLRVDNYSSHEGQVYCKAHHRQIFQPQVRLDNDDDVDIVAKSTSKPVDDYLAHRGRLSELSYSFLQPKLTPPGIRKRQMIICENQPVELPKDVVRSDTKVDDGIDQLNLNLNNILEKFERGTASNNEDSQPSSAGIVIDKPSFNIKKTLMAFETKSVNPDEADSSSSRTTSERPVVKKLTNLSYFMNRQSSTENESSTPVAQAKPLAVRRSESLMMRLKKYESRIAGEQVADEASDEDENNNNKADDTKAADETKKVKSKSRLDDGLPKRLINLSSLKNQWENGDISKRQSVDPEDEDHVDDGAENIRSRDTNACNGNSPSVEKNEELHRIRQQLASRKGSAGDSGPVSIKNIYENAIKEAQTQQNATRRDSSDLLVLNGLPKTSEIQQQLLQNGSNNQNHKSPSAPTTKDHFQLNLGKKANKLKERFEQGLINNGSVDDSDENNDDDGAPAMTKLEQIRQEKLEDLSIFTEGEIKAREARSLFQQIDRRLSAASGQQQQPNTPPNQRSLSSVSVSMRNKLLGQVNSTHDLSSGNSVNNSNASSPSRHNNCHPSDNNSHHHNADKQQQQPIRLTNNVRT